jgi:hypothetical protein
MSPEEQIKLFGMSLLMVERELDQVEKEFDIDLERHAEDDKDDEYYPQFPEAIRREASEMATHYELFYCLESTARTLIAERLQSEHGANWWDTTVPPTVKENVKKNVQREEEAAFTRRSSREIDYTTFGELGEIVRANWQTFSDTFDNEKAFTKVMTNLNLLRGPIAHCCPLADDEIERLRVTLKDWFRLME